MVGNFIASDDFGSRASTTNGHKNRAIFSIYEYTMKNFGDLTDGLIQSDFHSKGGGKEQQNV